MDGGKGRKEKTALRVFSSLSFDLKALSRHFSCFCGVADESRCMDAPVCTAPFTPPAFFFLLVPSSRNEGLSPLGKSTKFRLVSFSNPDLTSARRCLGRLEQTRTSRRTYLPDLIRADWSGRAAARLNTRGTRQHSFMRLLPDCVACCFACVYVPTSADG